MTRSAMPFPAQTHWLQKASEFCIRALLAVCALLSIGILI